MIAYTQSDGYTIIKENDKFFLVKPPFYTKEEIPLSEVDNTIIHFGFVRVDDTNLSFEEELLKLFDIRVKIYEESKATLEDRIKFFKCIPSGFLGTAVERVEYYISKSEYCRAIFSGYALLENENFKFYPELYIRLYNSVTKISNKKP